MRIVMAGSTGFIGKTLIEDLLASGHQIHLLTRRSPKPEDVKTNPPFTTHRWDGKQTGAWCAALNGADAVINLSGENIAGKRWSASRKKALRDSRIDSTRALIEGMKVSSLKPKVFINASAVGYYGSVEEGDVTEDRARGKGFLAELCEEWEREAKKAEALGVRTVLLRTGVVLARGGGALAKMEPPFRFFAGGPLGSGKQWFPWIHRDDEVGIIHFALEHSNVSGVVNATAPEPVRMAEFCRALGRAMGRPSWAPVPALALKLLLGEMSEMLLTGQRAVPKKILSCGYRFKYPEVGEALRALYQK